jgi:hypothetical protein
MNKQDLFKYIKNSDLVSLSDKFTGQIVLTLNINQGGVTDIEKNVKERIK